MVKQSNKENLPKPVFVVHLDNDKVVSVTAYSLSEAVKLAKEQAKEQEQSEVKELKDE